MIRNAVKAFIVSVLLLVVVMAFWLSTLQASHKGNWIQMHATLPTIERDQDTILIRSIRNFSYEADNKPSEVVYFDDEFSVSKVKRLWFGLSHFADMGMAHNLVSFEFEDGRFLSLSVEARMEVGQQYSPILGMIRQFEMIYVFGTEQDIIGLRSYVRKEPFYLYPMTLSKSQVESLLVAFLEGAQHLEHEPRFYNTVFNNCLSDLLLKSGAFSHLDILTDWRLLLPGYSHEVAQELGYINQNSNIETIQAWARVDPTIAPEDPEFSLKIRKGCASC